MKKSSDKKLSSILFLGALVALIIFVNSDTKQSSPVMSTNVDPDILPSIHSTSNSVHLTGVANGITHYNDQTITVINGYPSAEDIASAAGLSEGTYIVDQESSESVMIQNGDCIIIYTEAISGAQPKIIDLLNSCS